MSHRSRGQSETRVMRLHRTHGDEPPVTYGREPPGSSCGGRSAARGSGRTSEIDQLRGGRCHGWPIAGAKPLEPRQLIAGDEGRSTRRGKRDELHVEMEHRLGDGSTRVGRETNVDGCRVDVRHQARLLEELTSSASAEAGVAGVEVPTERSPLPVAAVTGEQHQPTSVDDEHAGHQMGAATVTGLEERQRPVPRRLTTSGRGGRREERSRRVPLIGRVIHIVRTGHVLHCYRPCRCHARSPSSPHR